MRIAFPCYGCMRTCYIDTIDMPDAIFHEMPQCDAFMKDEPGDAFVRKCREALPTYDGSDMSFLWGDN